jgi:hypothetical protein
VTLNAEALITQAVESTGHDDFDGTTWREGLDQLVASANAEADLTEMGELIFATQIGQSLANRLRVVNYRSKAPSGLTTIDQPIFIIGLPRTGTTLLSYLLDTDPATRSLLRWEVFASIPPPDTSTMRHDPRIATAQAEMDALYASLPSFKAIHHETGAGPTECVTLLGQEYRSVHYETLAHLPSYGRWHQGTDMRPAYAWERKVLEVLQSHAPGQWVLKSPCHNLALDALIDEFPDATFVVTHRDPVVAVGSLASLVTILAGLGTDRDLAFDVGARWLEVVGLMTDRYLDTRARLGSSPFVDIGYRDLVEDPIGAVDQIYQHAGRVLTAEAETAMAAYLTENPAGRFGRHDYELADYGLDRDQIRYRLTRYLNQHPSAI